ncbi:MAG: apolipoprotein N-acyltransferase [Acidobacteriota bacterium]
MKLFLALLSGACLVVIFPGFNFTWLAPVALAPLLIACARESNWKKRFLLGWASGVLFWFFICIWIQFVLEVHGGMGRWGGWGTFALFAALKGLYTAAFAAFAGPLLRRSWAIPAVAALWVAVEQSHGSIGLAWVGLGFTWLHLGNAAIDWPLLPRLAPLTGVLGISFVLAMTSCALALIALKRPPKQLVWLAALAALFVLPSLPAAASGSELVQVVQPDIDTESRWTTESFEQMEQRLATLSQKEDAPLIVWPEAPAPFYPDRPAFAAFMASIARGADATFLMGGVSYTKEGAPLNSAFLMNPEGRIVERYDKMELVPFGEYIPPAFDWVNRITGEAGDFQPGTRAITLPLGQHRMGAFICYESAFPNLVRHFTEQGAEVLVNLSNDGYFGDSDAREQHLSLVRMRAAENGRWILRSTNDGITAMVDPAGRLTDRIPQHTETSRLMRFNYERHLTVYVRYGDWFPWSCFVCSLAALIASAVADTRKSLISFAGWGDA